MAKRVSDLRVKIFSALSDPTRLQLLEYLTGKERCVCEILPAFDRSQSTVSKHLNILYDAGILDRRMEGRKTLYSIRDPFVTELIRSADRMVLAQIQDLKEAGEAIEKRAKDGDD